jgi:hypothetical protein
LACSYDEGGKGCVQNLGGELMKDVHLEEQERDARMQLRWLLEKQIVKMGVNWDVDRDHALLLILAVVLNHGVPLSESRFT